MEFALSSHLFVVERLQSHVLPGEEYDMRKFDAALTSLEHLNIFAKDRGAQILLENIPNELSTPERLLEFIQYTRLKLDVCFDAGHAHMGGGVGPAFQALKERIRSTHVHDNNGAKDEHLMPFEGGIDWARTMRDFRAVDGQFPAVFELRDYGPDLSGLAKVRQVIEKMEAIR